MDPKPKLAVHKFSSCDGCQLALLNAGPALFVLAQLVDIVHFVEAGRVNPDAEVDIALIEGSISTSEELERIKRIRANSKVLISIGACATAGGIQALRRMVDHRDWVTSIYADPAYVDTLSTCTPIADHVRVDHELWGCPVNTKQVFSTIQSLISGRRPRIRSDSVCVSCKQAGYVCIKVTQQAPCMGPVTQTGCGALCPKMGRACYGCYGPQNVANVAGFERDLLQHGFDRDTLDRQFNHINGQVEPFRRDARKDRP